MSLDEYARRLGTITRGEYSGLNVSIEEDLSHTGWHVFVYNDQMGGRLGDMPAYDLWSDDEEGVWEWIRDDFAVKWSDESVAPVDVLGSETPIFVEHRGRVRFFPTLSIAERYLGRTEVEGGECHFYDTTGNVVQVIDVLRDGGKGWLILGPTEAKPCELAGLLRSYLEGVPDLPEDLSAGLENAALPQLIECMVALDERARQSPLQRWIRRWRRRKFL